MSDEYIHDGKDTQGEWKPGKLIRIPDASKAHIDALQLHARALAAHCEMLGMNAENMVAAIANVSVPYPEEAYHKMMIKWGLINEKGEPLI
jgi:hypothetical protein